MFAALVVAGLGFFFYVNQSVLLTSQADAARQAALVETSLERLQVSPRFSGGDLWLSLNDTGGATSTVEAVFVTSMVGSTIISKSAFGQPYLEKTTDGLNFNLPLAVSPGIPTSKMTGCGPVPPGCDIAISSAAIGGYTGVGAIVASVLTSSGNVFSALYPPNPTSYTTTTTVTQTSASTTVIPGGSPSSNILVVQMVATPPIVFSCEACVNDTVTVYNYGNLSVTNVALTGVGIPPVPAVSSTGTASLPNGVCTPPPSTTIPAYSGSGIAPHIVFVCTYSAMPGAVGGYATFSGAATGTYGIAQVTSAVSISNAIQVGGSENILSQGPFTANIFFFKYTACTNVPPYTSASPCATNVPYPFSSPSSFPEGNPLPGSSIYFVALYVRLTNGFNTTISVLPYSYVMIDPTDTFDSSWYLVGSPSVGAPTYTPYYPNYVPGTAPYAPTLTAYTPSAVQCNSNPANCIQVESGRSAVLTFASCGFTPVPQTNWQWGADKYGDGYTSSSCEPNNPPCLSVAVGTVTTPQCPPAYTPISTYMSINISFLYKGQVYQQWIPFIAMLVT